ncbi:MAG: hypothetical protein AAFZ65_07580 [Planctomycetota bacterium]
MHPRTPLLALLSTTGLSLPALAGDPVLTPNGTEGDAVTDLGNLVRADNVAIDNAGNLYGEWDTSFISTNQDQVLLRNGVVLFQEGQDLPLPVGAGLGSFDSIVPNDLGDVAYNFFLDNSASGFDSGVYVNDVLVIQEGDDAPPPFSAGTIWRGFFDVKLNDANQLLVTGTVDDPLIASSVDEVMILFDLDANFDVIGSTVIAAEANMTPFNTLITGLEDSSQEVALNDTGNVMWAADTDGLPDFDGFISIDGTPIAIEGSPSPLAGINWGSLSSPELDLNNNGEFVYSGTLDVLDSATNAVLVKNDTIFRREGDSPPGLPQFALTSFGTAPLLINDLGEVLWYGDWDDLNTDRDSGLFIENTLLLQEGDTVNGQVVDTIRGITDGYYMSDDGTQIAVRVQYDGGVDGIVVITREGQTVSFNGCIPNVPTLDVTAGEPTIGESTTFEMGTSPYPSALAAIYFSGARLDNGIGCGLFLPGIGEVLLDLASFDANVSLPNFNGAPTSIQVDWPSTPLLIGFDIYFQGLFIDATLASPTPASVTNAIELCFGV